MTDLPATVTKLCRFVKVIPKTKKPFEDDWPTVNNYGWDDPRLQTHIKNGGNYGVMPAGGICIVDIDDLEVWDRLGVLRHFEDTFQVKTGNGLHAYILCPDAPPEKIGFKDPANLNPKDQIGDFRGSGHESMVIGPGCIHPSGSKYEPLNGKAVKPFTWDQLQDIFSPLVRTRDRPPVEEIKTGIPTGIKRDKSSITETFDLKVEEFLYPENAITRGDEIQGAHPIHGSETGMNLCINPSKGTYYCFRSGHECGGDAALAAAVKYGIIQCEDAKHGLSTDQARQLVRRLEQDGYINLKKIKPLPQISAGGGPSEPQIDYKDKFALWKKKREDGKDVWYIAGIDRQRALAYFREKYHPVSFRGTVWLYKDGVYSPEDGRINEELTEISIALDVQAQKTTYTELLLMMRGVNLHREMPFNKAPGVIPIQDGVLKINFETGEITGPHPHSPEYLFTYTLPVKYDPGADTEKLMDVFRQWVDDEDIKYLIQLPALAIIQSWGKTYKQAYLFEGPRNAGKTTYFSLIDRFIGIENRTTITLHRLVIDRFASAGLVGKLMNIVDELPSVTLANLDSFKAMIGGRDVTVELKGKDSYSTRLRAVHCFNCNTPPACKISDDPAWWDRWVYVRFPNEFPKNPKWQDDFLTDETVSAFLNLILKKITDIMKGNADYMDAEDVKQIWMESSDILYRFIEQECKRDAEGEIPKEDFYDRFVKFCQAREKSALSKTACTHNLQRMGIACARPKKGESRVRAYRGLVWKQPSQNPSSGDNPENPAAQTKIVSDH